MQPGVFFIWVLSVAGTFVLGAVYRSAFLRGKAVSRRRMSGCELARQYLDRRQLNQIPVLPVREGLNSLVLPEKIYSGTRLEDLAKALYQAVRFWRESRSLLPPFLVGEWKRAVPMGILLSWVLVISGFFIPRLAGLAFWGRMIFMAFVLRAVALLAEDWEVSEESLAFFQPMEGWTPEEKFQMRRLLRSLRWSRFSEIFEAPWSFFALKKQNAVPQPKRVY